MYLALYGWGGFGLIGRRDGAKIGVMQMQDQEFDELMICRLDSGRKSVDPGTIVIFGASGDLTVRKLIPALYHLFEEGALPKPFKVVGFARREKSDESWREELLAGFMKYSRTRHEKPARWEEFAAQIHYCQASFDDSAGYNKLRGLLESFEDARLRHNLLFYLATSPTQFAMVAEQLHHSGLLQKEDTGGYWQRLVVEKPFGTDLASAKELNQSLMRFAHEKQIFRIDHYLGKETVQNILVFRFSNYLIEQNWNREAIDHIQITVSEDMGVGGRGGYYEDAGALRDMVQNHLLQVLALTAMEPPAQLEAEAIRDEKVKVLRSIRPMTPEQVGRMVVRGQYSGGEVNGKTRPAYRAEDRVHPQSNVETYVGMKLLIDNWRWSGVPFYLRTGKNMPFKASEVRVQFKRPPQVLFAAQCGTALDANSLTLRLQPEEGITLHINGKIPGASMQLRPVRMRFSYDSEFGAYTPEAYERLLLEAMAGDPTLFIRRDELEVAWALVDSIREGWGDRPMAEDEFYPAGTWGPVPADGLLQRTNRAWKNPAPH